MRLSELEKTRTTNPLNNGTVDDRAWEIMDVFDDVQADLSDELKLINPEIHRDELVAQLVRLRRECGRTTTIAIDKLISIEPDFSKAHVDKITGSDTKLPLVFKIKNEYVIADGNHRIIAKYLSGDKTVAVNSVDIKDFVDLVDTYYRARTKKGA